MIRRAIDLNSALKVGIQVSLEGVPADELITLLILDELLNELNQQNAVWRDRLHGAR